MNKEFYTRIGSIIKDARIEKRMTQDELANRLGVKRPCLANWEQGRRTINADDVIRICDILDIDIIELVKKVDKYVH